MSKDKILTSLAIHLKRWPREKDGEDIFRIANRQASIISAVSVDAEDGRTRVYVGDHQFTEWQWHMRRQEMALDGWVAGEERMEAIGSNGPTGDHYAEDSDGESALSEALREQDAGAHYRREYKGIKLDPYRIAKVYGMQGGPREQIMKKCLRFTDKGQTEQQVVDEIRTALNRWQEMLEEGES